MIFSLFYKFLSLFLFLIEPCHGADSFTAVLKINLILGSESIEWNGNAWAFNCKFEGKELSSSQTSGLFHFYHLYNACFTD